MDKDLGENTVSLEPSGVVLVRLVGNQSYTTIEAVGKACGPIIERLKYDHKPILGLVDFTEHKNFTSGSHRAVLEVLEGFPYQRVAMFGTSPVHREVAKALIAALGKSANTKLFTSEDEAVAWLVNKDPIRGYGD